MFDKGPVGGRQKTSECIITIHVNRLIPKEDIYGANNIK